MALKECNFVQNIIADMVAQGWLYDPSVRLSVDSGLVAEDLCAWMATAYPIAWDFFVQRYGDEAQSVFVLKVRSILHEHGTLTALSHPFLLPGVKDPFLLMCASTDNVAHGVNRLRILTEVVYTPGGQQRLDMVLTVNGIPTATAECKFEAQQSVHAAIAQYQYDRVVDDACPSMLLSPVEGALAHFAVSDSLVYVSGCLRGSDTQFLPFNKGNDNRGGNPVNPLGYMTDYLWKDIWSPASWLDICRFFVKSASDNVLDGKGWIFPRYHQFDLVQKSLQSIRGDGVNRPHLVQHSAGSGKTKTIAWLADALAREKGEDGNYIYSSIIVLSDREVIDKQLQAQLERFSFAPNIVQCIDVQRRRKSSLLAEALSVGTRIIVCTIQTFKYLSDEIMSSSDGGGRYVILADEAHSSQSGATAIKARGVLHRLGRDPDADTGYDGQDAINGSLFDLMQSRANNGGRVAFFAFTATPRDETRELFGTRNVDDGAIVPFHVYSMRQAIDEGFILDVLKNYTTLDTYAQVVLNRPADAYNAASGSAQQIARWVKDHPDNIAYRARLIIGHYVGQIRPMLDGKAKAMVVTANRLAAVNMVHALHEQAASMKIKLRVMVAFSDTLNVNGKVYTESGVNMGLGVPPGSIADVFDDVGDILVVASKYRTGFDQPLLCGMYVDRELKDISAVQTLSRLNRSYLGKECVYVLDFVNKADDIIESFAPYYTASKLFGASDVTVVDNLRCSIESSDFLAPNAVQDIVRTWFNISGGESALEKDLVSQVDVVVLPILSEWSAINSRLMGMDAVNPAVELLRNRLDVLRKLRADMQSYIAAYQFFAQMYTYTDTGFESLYIALTHIVPRLHFPAIVEYSTVPGLSMYDYRLHNASYPTLALDEVQVELSPAYPVDEDVLTEDAQELLSVRPIDSHKDMSGLLEEFHRRFASLNNDQGISLDQTDMFVQVIARGVLSMGGDNISRDELLQRIHRMLSTSMMNFSLFCAHFLGSPENLAAFERMIATHSPVKLDVSDI